MSEERAQVAHLLRRTGFGTTAAAVDAAVAGGYEATVAAMLTVGADDGVRATPPPELAKPAGDARAREGEPG